MIEKDVLQSARRALNLEDIAEKAGVSRSTVSRVINDEPYVSEKTRQRVIAVIEREGYTPNLAARQLVTQRTQVIGVIHPHVVSQVFENPYYFPSLLQGIAEATSEHDYATLLWWLHDQTEEERLRQRVVRHHRMTDGLILASARTDDPLLEHLTRLNTPFMLVERPPIAPETISYVSIDNITAAYNAVTYLVSTGRQRIATITGALNNVDGQDRLEGYRLALAHAGLPFDAALVAEGYFSRISGYHGMQRLIDRRPDAVFAGNDMTAIGAMQFLSEIGVCVPDDVALIGFDDMPIAAQTDPPLTTVQSPVQQKAYEATRLLIEMIDDGGAPRQKLLPTQLIIRAST